MLGDLLPTTPSGAGDQPRHGDGVPEQPAFAATKVFIAPGIPGSQRRVVPSLDEGTELAADRCQFVAHAAVR